MSNQIVISSGAKVRNLDGVLTASTGVVSSVGYGLPNGVATLDGSGKIPVTQLPNSVMEFKGVWNAATNTPTLADGTGNAGDVYLCNVAGTVNFGSGPISFAVGDYAVYTGTVWARSSGATGTVTSVAVTESGDALNITGSPITTSGTINIGFAGTSAQYVAGDGSLITFPTLTGYVPYTGATSDVDLGAFSLNAKSLHIKGVGGNGHLGLKHQSANPTGSANESLLFADVNGNFGWQNDNLYLTTLSTHANTANRTYTFPNASGTVALTSDLSAYVTLATTQTISGQKTFSVQTNFTAAINLLNNQSLNFYNTGNTFLTGLYPSVGLSGNRTIYLPDSSGTVALTSDINYPVTSVFGRTGAVTAQSGDYTTTQVTEGTNLYFTNARARGAISLTTTGTSGVATYNSTTGVLNIPNYSETTFGTVTSVGLSSATSGVTIGSSPITTSGTITLAIATASGTQQGLLSSTDWTTFNNKQAQINGTGFVKASGTTISYDNSTYLTTSAAASTYVPYSGASTYLNMGNNYIYSSYYTSQGDGTNSGSIILKQRFAANGAPSGYSSINAFGDTTFLFWFNDGTTNRRFYFNAGLLGSTSRTYTLPDADGTVALTSNLGAYLPLTGGTLTGALNGTSATFSSTVQVNSNITGLILNRTAVTNYNGIGYRTNGVGQWFVGLRENLSSNNYIIYNENTGTDVLTLSASTGAATFSSSVTANGVVVLGSNSSASPFALGTSTARFQLMNGGVYGLAGDVLTNGNTYLQSQRTDGNTAAYNLLLQPLGGNVGIGTSSPFVGGNPAKLQVRPATDINIGFQVGTADTTGIKLNAYNDAASVNIPMELNGSIMILKTGESERMRILTGGQVCMGTTSSIGGGDLSVQGSSGAQISIGAKNVTGANANLYLECAGQFGAGFYADRASGSMRGWVSSSSSGVSLAAGGTSWGSYSDERLKNIIEPISDAVDKVKTLRAVIGRYNFDEEEKRRVFLIAQDVQKVLPEAVFDDKSEDKILSLQYTDIIPLLVKAIQELKQEIDELKNK